MIFIYFFCTKIAGTRHVLFVQLHSILKGARRFGFPTKTPPLAANAATAARRTPQEGRQCPPLVRTPPASLVRQSDRALCNGVLRRGLGRVRGPVWAKNRPGRALTCVSFPPSQRRAPFRGIHKGVPPYVCFLSCFLHKQKTSRPPGRDRASCAAYGTPLKNKVTCRTAAQKESPRGGGFPASPAAHLLKKARCCAAAHTFYPWWIDKAAKSWENGIQLAH